MSPTTPESVQAGALEIGERLQTLSGDVKVVQQKLPRPGPQPVFNLEVHAEHAYFVGQDGVLVHNSGKGTNAVYAGGNLIDDVTVFRVQPKGASDIVTGGAFRRARESGTDLVSANEIRRSLARNIDSTDQAMARKALVDAQANGRTSPFISTTFDQQGAMEKLAAMRAAGHNVELVTIVGPRSGGVDFNAAFNSIGGRTKRFRDAEMMEFGIRDLFIPATGTSRSGFRILNRQ